MRTPAPHEQVLTQRPAKLPSVRIGVAAGLIGMLCCVGPTVLALLGVLSAGTAFAWAHELYTGFGWVFRFSGLLLLAALGWWSLRRRGECSPAGARRARRDLTLAVAVALGTYAALYAGTTWLGTFA